MVRRAFLLLLASLLAAGPLLADVYRPGPGDTITADATGLHLSAPDGSAGRDLPFGTPFHVVMRTLVEIVGHEVYVAFPGECPDGPLVNVTLPGQIDLNFREDRLAGWFLGPQDEVATTGGLAIGADRASLETGGTQWRTESTLGEEFGRGGVFGLVSEDGKTVTHLWAGTACIFR
jgi:hypothetical protein